MIRVARHQTFAYGIPAALAFLTPLFLVMASLLALWSMAVPSLDSSASLVGTIKALINDKYVMRAVGFTLTQAALSAMLSSLLAIPLARALATRSFPGKTAILSLFGAPFILPVIVAILGLLAIWGKNGPVHALVSGVGLSEFSIYGLSGILLAHVFFNLPLATRILLQGWLSIPSEQWRLTSQLGMTSGAIARHVEWPMLKERLPGTQAIVFLLCVTSFTVVLALGGGPKATTIELAIYQAIRYDFDLERAALLACLQICLCAGLALISRLVSQDHDTGESLGGTILRSDRTSRFSILSDAAVIALSLAFLALPLAAAFLRGLNGLIMNPIDLDALLPATLRSLAVAIGACLVMGLISLPLAQLSVHLTGKTRRLVELPGFAIMVAPPHRFGRRIVHPAKPAYSDRQACLTPHRAAQRLAGCSLCPHPVDTGNRSDQARLRQADSTSGNGSKNCNSARSLALDAQTHWAEPRHHRRVVHRRSWRHRPVRLTNRTNLATLSLSADGCLSHGSSLRLSFAADCDCFWLFYDFRQRIGWP